MPCWRAWAGRPVSGQELAAVAEVGWLHLITHALRCPPLLPWSSGPAIQTLDIPPSCAAVAEVAQQQSTLSAKLTIALAAVDRGGEWGIDGSASMGAWVRNHLGLTHSTAARVLRRRADRDPRRQCHRPPRRPVGPARSRPRSRARGARPREHQDRPTDLGRPGRRHPRRGRAPRPARRRGHPRADPRRAGLPQGIVRRRRPRPHRHRPPPRGCRGPGAHRGGEGHHIRHWEDGGRTDLSNLASR